MGCSYSPETGFRELPKRIRITQPLIAPPGGPVRGDGQPEREDQSLVRQLCQKAAQLGRCLELRHGIELFECACERVRQAPHGPGREFRVLRLEVHSMDLGQQAPGRVQLAIDECGVQDQPCGIVGELRFPPQFNLALQGLEIRWILSTPTESVSIKLKLLVCLARTGANTPVTMFPNPWSHEIQTPRGISQCRSVPPAQSQIK
jgi:hypothetical protein